MKTRAWIAGAVAALALGAFIPSRALACDACHHGKKAAADQAAVQEKKQPEKVQRAQGSVLEPVDQLLADKCTCESAADCTCKKGTCKCPKCGKKSQMRMIAPIKGTRDALRLPQGGTRDASSGVFI